jgi:hypothetical protein
MRASIFNSSVRDNFRKCDRSIPHLKGDGAGEEVRTLDFQLGRLALYQLSYTRIKQNHNDLKN